LGGGHPSAIIPMLFGNLWTRNIYKEYLRSDATPKQEARQGKSASVVVKLGAVACIVFINAQFSIDLQLIGVR
jgi:SSS family solute:Na+ symporter